MDLLSIGGITFDNLFRVDRLPEEHFEGIIKEHGRYFGGRAPNVAVGAVKLGIKTGIVSAVGEDFTSGGYEDHLRTLGIDMRGIVKVPRRKTKQIFIFTDPNGGQITFFDYGAEAHFRKMEAPRNLIKESRIIHISSSGDYKFNTKCADIAHQNRIPVSFDPGNDPFTEIPEYLRAMMARCKILIMNNIEASAITARLNVNSIDDFFDLGPDIIVVINKVDKSSLVCTKDSQEQIPSVLRRTRDPTGASDGYVAAFLSGYIKGYDLKTSGILGSVEASFVTESLGSQTNLPNWKSLLGRCRKRFKGLSSIS